MTTFDRTEWAEAQRAAAHIGHRHAVVRHLREAHPELELPTHNLIELLVNETTTHDSGHWFLQYDQNTVRLAAEYRPPQPYAKDYEDISYIYGS